METTNAMRFPTTIFGAALLAWLFSSCAGMNSPYNPPIPSPLVPAPAAFAAPPPVYQSSGSLWSSATPSLWSDPVAHTVADVIFVNVTESSTASHTADTKTERSNDIDLGITNLFGQENDVNTIHDDDPTDGIDPDHIVRANTENNSDNTGETTREGRLEARVSAQVVQVLPNGNLQIYGSQVLSINNENQLLTVSGIARPIDIHPDNSIDSFLLAEARIEFTGRGVLSDVQRPGWGSRAASWIWPF